MQKGSLLILLVMGVIIMLFLARKRIWTALKLTAAAFVALNVYRIAQRGDAAENLLVVGLTLGVFGLCWLVLWAITRMVERNRALHPIPPRASERRTRWRL